MHAQGTFAPIPAEVNATAAAVVDALKAVRRDLGPGLLETAYAARLADELSARGRSWSREVDVPLVLASGETVAAYRADFIVEGRVLVEIKSVTSLMPVHVAQVVTYLRLARLRLGILVNFSAAHPGTMIRRIAN